ncbi:MAG: metallophosphoesterase [Spirochaetaceae bacterium]|jgi:3',5'-cyclic AMP phosphodiesterase CpdA|nr:metallophosphoesterase [Spirochaetaceae bacterium]
MRVTRLILFSALTAFFGGCGLQGAAHRPAETPDRTRREISIYITNDVHFLAPSLHDSGQRYRNLISGSDGKNIEALPVLLEALSMTIGAEKPDILLVNGDLTFNGERESHRSLARYFEELEKTGTQVFVLPGNHDIANPFARSFFGNEVRVAPSVNPGEFASIYRNFGFAGALSRDRASLSYVAEPFPGLRLLMLDSCKYKNNKALGFPELGGAFSEATRKWIRGEARKARRDGALFVVSMHHNAMDHHPLINEGFTIDDDESFQDLLAEEGIQFVLSGHIHAQEISMRQRDAGTVYDIATSSLAVYPHQTGVLSAVPDGPLSGEWRYAVKPPDVETWARAADSADEGFQNFNQYSKDYFTRISGNMARRRLDTSALSDGEMDALGRLMGLLNSRYFSGTSYLNAQDIPDSPEYRLLQEHDYEFLSSYVKTIMEDRPPRDTELTIPFPGE